MTLEELFKKASPHLIGVWKFREVDDRGNNPGMWCATFHWRSTYYDVNGKDTPNSAIEEVLKKIEILRKRKKKK